MKIFCAVMLLGFVAHEAIAQCPDGAAPPCATKALRPVSAPAHSVAVLYFENLSRDTSDAYLAEGLTDEITARLGQVGRLVVTSRTAVRRLKNAAARTTPELGRDLNVTYLVNGTVRRSLGNLRVGVELLRASDGVQVWSNQFDRTQTDLLAIQEQIAVAVANAIVGRLLPSEKPRLEARPTRSALAYDYYLRASRALIELKPPSFERAVSGFETALRLDPKFVAAQGRLAFAYGLIVNWDWTLPGVAPGELVSRGLQNASRALETDSLSSDAWVGRGMLLFFRSPPDYEGSINSLRRGVALDSLNATAHYAYGLVLRRLGDFATSEAEYRRAVELDPDQRLALGDLGLIAYTLRRFPEARDWYERSVAADSTAWHHLIFLSRIRLALRDTAGARRDAESAVRHAPPAAAHLALAVLSQVEAALGDTAAARARLEPVLAEVPGNGPLTVRDGYEFALGLLGIGRRDEAIGMLSRVQPRGAWLWSYLILPWFDPLRADPRFVRIVEEARPAAAPHMR